MKRPQALESDRPELEPWLHHSLAVGLKLTQPQFPQLQDGYDNTSSFVYEDVDNATILGRVIVKIT